MKKKYPKVSIVVVSWNGKDYLKMCLSSMRKIIYPNFEAIVVDNASSDGSVEYIKKYYPWVKLIESKENLGYVGGNNLGIRKTKGDYIYISNNDVEVKPNFLSILVDRIESNPKIACVQPKLREYRQPEFLDSVGAFLTDTPFLYHFGRLKPEKLAIYNRPMEIYSAKGAAMLLRRKTIEKIDGAFDPDFFIYYEETDLCHRLWLAGYKVVYEPKAVIKHVVAGDTSAQFKGEFTLYLSLRNRICSFIKNYGSRYLLQIMLLTLTIYSFLALVYLFTGKFSLVKAIIRAIGWNLRNFPASLKKRKFIQQKLRIVPDRELLMKFKKNLPLTYYHHLFKNSLGDFKDIDLFN